MNSNLFHNILNLVAGIIGVLILTDWTALGFSTTTAAQIAAGTLIAQNVIKLTINVTRDGLTGLIKAQPPVKE
ncbi:hypothetical protein [Pararhizobium gei]|uniref:hypothetical protein n=1 Tax=Pararhizobium gei TaxID=1395951 RepID=UPI0023DAC0CF|nr:hypothetical protein [Rhizobium gei]